MSSTQTNAQGFYNFPALPTGKYEVRIKATGFEEYRETDLVLDVNNALRIDAAMKVGSVSQEVSVSSTAVHVETTNTQMGEVIGTTKMTSLPLNGRSYTDLLALQPGVAPSSSGEGRRHGCFRKPEPRCGCGERAAGKRQWLYGEWRKR